MRQQVVTQAAAGSSAWLFVDNRRFSTDFNLGLQTTIETGTTLTYDVELTKDLNSSERWKQIAIARLTTTATVTLANHGLKTGDNVIIFDTNFTNHSPESNLEGSFDITVTGVNTFTYTVADTGAAAAIGRMISFNVVDHADIAAETTAQTGSQTEPVSAVRLNVTAFTDGFVTLTVLQQG